MIRRRAFIVGFGSATCAVPFAPIARAQEKTATVVGLLSGSRLDDNENEAVRKGLAETGYIEGRNIAIDYRTADGEYDIDVDVPAGAVMYPCDRDLIMQAIANLLHNSVRHCAHPVHITLALRREEGGVVISVADDGPGISAADRDRVLKRYVRLDNSRRTPGTGLGLSLVAAIAELHGARLDLADHAPGLKVSIRLPAR